MSHTYLFELGTEEIPAGMIEPALDQMKGGFVALLSERQCPPSGVGVFSTPRRLAICLEGLPEREPDREERVTGPPKAAAYDDDGAPTAAATGFAAKLGVDVDQLTLVSTDRGEYVAVDRMVEGQPVPEILAAAAAGIVASIDWPKTMYWSPSRFRFIRPLRWFVSLWDNNVVAFEMEGVTAGRASRGHRSLSSGAVEIRSASEYVSELRDHRVLADPAERRRRIEEGLRTATPDGLRIRSDTALLETVVQLNEFPSVLRGDFDPAYLEIPAEVLVTVMRHHQKYFSLEDGEGNLAPHFLTVTNSDGDPDGEIRSGHEKVLKARLEDAAFFWQSDCSRPLADRVADLQSVLFQEELGSYLDKTERIRKLLARLDADPVLDEAALLAKADLTTDMVRELPELQGIMGGLYAREAGSPAWEAVYGHYEPVGADDPVPENRRAALLSAADRLDTLAGCFSVGIVPTGSRDPFALRRQAQGLVRILLRHDLPWSLDELLGWAAESFEISGEMAAELQAFVLRRVRHLLRSEGLAADVVNAVLATRVTTVADAVARARAVAAIKPRDDFQALAAAFKRIRNLLEKSAAGEAAAADVEAGDLAEPAEKALHDHYRKLKPRLEERLVGSEYEEALRDIAGLRPAVDRFFDEVMVMTDDEQLRRNRLALLKRLVELFGRLADISEIHHGRTS